MEKTRAKKSQLSVRFDENIPSERDGNENDPDSIKIFTNGSSSVIKSGGDMNSASSISTSILDDAEDVKALKKKVQEMGENQKAMEEKMEELDLALSLERSKNVKLERKLQFVKDNQEVFIRLKEAYINMKYNEAVGRKMIEVREKSVQTWEGILCRGCIETEELRRQLESLKENYSSAYIVNHGQMLHLMNTMKYLKDLIDRREKSWMLNAEREQKLTSHISLIEEENAALRALAKNQAIDPEGIVICDRNSEQCKSEVHQLKKIIIKLGKRLRETEQGNEENQKLSPCLNDKEKKIVQQLLTKYSAAKIHKDSSNNLSPARDRSRSRSSHKAFQESHSREANLDADYAIMMMDSIFCDDQ